MMQATGCRMQNAERKILVAGWIVQKKDIFSMISYVMQDGWPVPPQASNKYPRPLLTIRLKHSI